MAKDALGNEIQEGDKILLNGIIMTVKKVNGGNLIGGQMINPNKMAGLVLQGEITCEMSFPFDPTKLLAVHVLKQPPEDTRGSA